MLLYRAASLFLNLIMYLILGRAIMSWFVRPGDRMYQLYGMLIRLTEPLLMPFRRLTDRFGWNNRIDVSPLLAFFVIILLQRVIAYIYVATH